MYNGNGSIGRLDVLLRPFYEQDIAAGGLTEEEAIFHVACEAIAFGNAPNVLSQPSSLWSASQAAR